MSSSEKEINVPGPLGWLGPFYKFGLPGITIAGMGFLIWTLISFITGSQSQKIDEIKSGIAEQIRVQKETKDVVQDILEQEKTEARARDRDHKEMMAAIRELTRATYRRNGGSGRGDASDLGMNGGQR